jgi:hypothetical protein
MRLLLGLVSVPLLPKRPLDLLRNPIAQSLVADTAAHGRTKRDPPMLETGDGVVDCCAIAAPEARQSDSAMAIKSSFMFNSVMLVLGRWDHRAW